ncbi:MAG: CRISPR-associated protein Cas4 [Desulfovibrio sp.]
MYAEDDLLPLSALQHLLYCPRQCALIHLERLWVENEFTAQGRVLHSRAHEGEDEWRGAVRLCRGMALRSLDLGLIGVADVVEFRPTEDGGPPRPYPVEYKRGRPKQADHDRVQLCAQALCLEEMLALDIPEGALFYGKSRRREVVPLDAALRATTREAAARLHALIRHGATPPAEPGEQCRACSLEPLCLPRLAKRGRDVAAYLKRMVQEE